MYLPDTYGTADLGNWAQQFEDYARVLLELLRMFRLGVSLKQPTNVYSTDFCMVF